MRSATQWTALLLGLSAAAAGTALARPFQIGEVEGVANLELSYGLLARIERRNPELVAIVNGGSAASASSDDGDLNYDTGIVSNMIQASGELDLRWRSLGLYLRGIGFYDFETELTDRERTPLSSGADTYVGKHVELRDYHLDARFQRGGFVEGRKAFSVGVAVDYTNTWLLQLDYTNLFGAGRFNLLTDRDFVRFQLSYFY